MPERNREIEAAWQRLEEASGLDRTHFAVGVARDDEARTALQRPDVLAALDEVRRALGDVATRALHDLDESQARLDDLQAANQAFNELHAIADSRTPFTDRGRLTELQQIAKRIPLLTADERHDHDAQVDEMVRTIESRGTK